VDQREDFSIVGKVIGVFRTYNWWSSNYEIIYIFKCYC
jgi:hypothetical protein